MDIGPIRRLIAVANRDTGQSRLVANFLLAWHNAHENGGWDPVEMWGLDSELADDMIAALRIVRHARCYPDTLGLKPEMQTIWARWRKPLSPVPSKEMSGILGPIGSIKDHMDALHGHQD